MSSDFNVYVGTMLKIKSKITHVPTIERRCEKCNYVAWSPYCPKCGSKVIEKEALISKTLTAWEIINECNVDDYFFSPNGLNNIICFNSLNKFHCFISNDENFFEMPERGDESCFQPIINYLKANNIEYEVKFGIQGYWN